VLWHILIKLSILDNGKKAKSMGLVLMFSSRQEWNLLENGQLVRLFLESGATLTELVSRDNLTITNQRARANGFSKMVMSSKVFTHRLSVLSRLKTISSSHGRQHPISLQSLRTESLKCVYIKLIIYLRDFYFFLYSTFFFKV
jgi:hypothetical protein